MSKKDVSDTLSRKKIHLRFCTGFGNSYKAGIVVNNLQNQFFSVLVTIIKESIMSISVSFLRSQSLSKYGELEPLCVFANVVIDTIPTKEDSQLRMMVHNLNCTYSKVISIHLIYIFL